MHVHGYGRTGTGYGVQGIPTRVHRYGLRPIVYMFGHGFSTKIRVAGHGGIWVYTGYDQPGYILGMAKSIVKTVEKVSVP